MAKDKVSTPQSAGGNDFSALVASALDSIVTTAGDGTEAQPSQQPAPTNPGYPPAEFLNPQVLPTPHNQPQVAQRAPTMAPEDHSQAAYRDMLRREEELLARRPQRPEPPMPPALALVYGVPVGADVSSGKIEYKGDANPLLVEAHQFLITGVAGNMIPPYGSFYQAARVLLDRIGAEVVVVRASQNAVIAESK